MKTSDIRAMYRAVRIANTAKRTQQGQLPTRLYNLAVGRFFWKLSQPFYMRYGKSPVRRKVSRRKSR